MEENFSLKIAVFMDRVPTPLVPTLQYILPNVTYLELRSNQIDLTWSISTELIVGNSNMYFVLSKFKFTCCDVFNTLGKCYKAFLALFSP